MAQNLIKLIDSFIDQSNDTQDHLLDLSDIYDVDTASGWWLDRLNDIVGGSVRNPNSYNDTELRSRIKAKIDINKEAGTIKGILNAVRYYLILNDFNNWSTVKDTPLPYTVNNGNVYITVTTANVNKSQIKEVVNFAPAGVGVYLLFEPATPFGFNDDAEAFGFSDDVDGGGVLVERITL
jgi:hypothetical protein